MEEVERQYEFKKHHMKISKEICEDLITRSLKIGTINDDNSDLIKFRISNVDNFDDIYILDTILDCLFKSAYLGHHMNDNDFQWSSIEHDYKLIHNKYTKKYYIHVPKYVFGKEPIYINAHKSGTLQSHYNVI